MEGLKNGGGGGGMDDIFSMFMGGGRPGGKQQVKVKPIVKKVEVSLADIYNGTTVEVDVDRQRICGACEGIGGSDASAVQKC
jgi:DnaJ-class molecular chaperone